MAELCCTLQPPVMLQFQSCCRYGFVKFMTKEGANKAMQELHQTEMPAFSNMKVGRSQSQWLCSPACSSHQRVSSLAPSSLDSSFSFCFLPQLRFQPSQSKNKLYLGNIPKDMMKDRIHAKLDEHVKGSYNTRSLLLTCLP